MKKSLIYIVSSVAILLAGNSCSKDFLELEPKTGQTEANYYKTEEQAFLAMTAVYDAYSVQNWQFVPVMADIWSDDAYCGGANANDMAQWQDMESFKMTPENNSSSDLWSRCYSGIYRANLYLQKQDGIDWVTDGLKTRYEGEVKFLRAYFYWDLVRHYGWVPLITSVLPSVEDYKSVTQSSPDVIFTQIAADLLDAVEVLPEDFTAAEAGRVTKAAAQALIARIYLYHTGMSAIPELGLTAQQWTDGTTLINKAYVQSALDEIITEERYHLIPSYADLFSWDDQNNAESILEIQYSDKAKSGDWGGWNINGNFSCVWLSVRNPQGDPSVFAGWSFDVPSWSLANEFEAGDPRKDVTLYNAEESMTDYNRAFMNTGYFNKKFMARTAYIGSGGEQSHNFPRNFMDIRYADVLLMAAEVWLTDNNSKAAGYLSQVRTRALGAGAAKTSITIDDIYHERRVEFGGEGSRKWDLLRRGLTFAETKVNASFVLPGGTPNAADFAGRVFDPDSWGMFPIPASDIRNCNAGVLKQMVKAYASK
jgi:starch-binding outer membrane protein, SusD/RagB family